MSTERPFLDDLVALYADGALLLFHCEACDLVYFPSDTIRCSRCANPWGIHLVGLCGLCRNLYIPPPPVGKIEGAGD